MANNIPIQMYSVGAGGRLKLFEAGRMGRGDIKEARNVNTLGIPQGKGRILT
jgi:hypothetical protein